MDPFDKFFHKSQAQLGVNGIQRRHRKPMPGVANYDRKHLNMVPANVAQKHAGKCEKLEILKQRNGRFFLDENDLNYIVANFLKGVKPGPGELKTLGGKMNIQLYQDPGGKWVIEKK